MSRAERERRRVLQNLIRRCEEDIAAFRGQAESSRDEVVNLAKRLGREPRPGKQRGEPMYDNMWYDRRSVAIPNKSPLRKGTKHKILNELEGDLEAMRQQLEGLGGPINGDADA